MRMLILSRTVCALSLGVASAPANAVIQTIVDVAIFAANFVEAGFSKPTITMTETETTFRLSITGGPVGHTIFDDSGTFTAPFILNFWRGNVTFSQLDGLINPDSVTASLTMFHQAGINRPHTGDELTGDLFTFPSTTLQAGNPPSNFGKVEKHNKSHFDRYYDGVFSVGGIGDTINGWNFVLKADHQETAVPEPRTWAMLVLGFGLVGYLIRRRRNPLTV